MEGSLLIAIIGGGPGGLTLARILQKQGIHRVTVYEQEESRFVRGQGGTLDLHRGTGQYALKLAGLLEEFKTHSRAEGEDLRVLDKNGFVHYEEVTKAGKNDRPEIDRSKLRDILLDSLAEDTVRWGWSFRSLTPVDNGKFKLQFAHGRTAEADFVVGADGAWSRVRTYISDAKPEYAGINFVEMTLRDVEPKISALVGRGSMVALDEGKAIIAQRNGDGIVKVYAGIRAPMDWLTVDLSDPVRAKIYLLGVFQGWSEELLDLIRSNSGDFIHRLIYALPIGHSWQAMTPLTGKITLIGDAAHVMSPFAGEGVNLAMMDAACLALALNSPPGRLDDSVLQFERKMFARAVNAARESADNLVMMFGEGGAIAMANLMKEYNTWYFPIKYVVTYLYRAIFDYFYSLLGWN